MQEYMKTLSISELQLPARVYLKLMRDNVTTLEKLANCDISSFRARSISKPLHFIRKYLLPQSWHKRIYGICVQA